MSIQFGRWNLDGKPVDPCELESVKSLFAAYGQDRLGCYSSGNVGILYQFFQTTKESRREMQPHISSSGAVITLDGRLDNAAELVREMPGVLKVNSTDVEIVAAAYERWGTDCFRRLIGDWALAIWTASTRSLILAKDFLGVRHLYYSVSDRQITWSTILDPFIVGETGFRLCEEYIAGWFSLFPATHLTPYVGVRAVPPASFAELRPEKHTITKYWDFDHSKKIRYVSDGEYEEHFRTAFIEAVRRRLRSDAPIVAELSGGMDSSSIVCVADIIIENSQAGTPRVETVSYYNDSEPNWNERPYVTKIEEKRGRPGCHIDVSAPKSFKFDFDRISLTPGAASPSTAASMEFEAYLSRQGARVVLSGIGGDEITGGVPSPLPELQNLVASAQFRRLAHRLKLWALENRKPWFHLLIQAISGFFPSAFVSVPKHRQPAPWLQLEFVRRNRSALLGYRARLKLFGPEPSFQEHINTMEGIRRQLECFALPSSPVYETRYPFLDRGLMEFMYAIPRDQLVRPGQRRSLMRRSLVGIVPDEVLNRKRKAFVSRSPRVAIASQWPTLTEMTQQMASDSFGILDPTRFAQALDGARQGGEVAMVSLMRTVLIEYWLQHLISRGIVAGIDQGTAARRKSRSPTSCFGAA